MIGGRMGGFVGGGLVGGGFVGGRLVGGGFVGGWFVGAEEGGLSPSLGRFVLVGGIGVEDGVGVDVPVGVAVGEDVNVKKVKRAVAGGVVMLVTVGEWLAMVIISPIRSMPLVGVAEAAPVFSMRSGL